MLPGLAQSQALWHLSLPPDSVLHWRPSAAAEPRRERPRPPVDGAFAMRRATASAAAADSATWLELGAPVRAGHLVVRDVRRGRLLLAGGEGSREGANDLDPRRSLWSYEPALQLWQLLGHAPGPASYDATTVGAAYDSLRDELLTVTNRAGVLEVDALALGGASLWRRVWTAPSVTGGYSDRVLGAAALDTRRDRLAILVPDNGALKLFRIPLAAPAAWEALSLPAAAAWGGDSGHGEYDAARDRFWFPIGAGIVGLAADGPPVLEPFALPDPEYLARRLALDRDQDALLVVDNGGVSWSIPLAGGTPLRLDDRPSWGWNRAWGQDVAFDPVTRRLLAVGGFRYVQKLPPVESLPVDSGTVWSFGTPRVDGAAWRTEGPCGLGSRFRHSSLVDVLGDRLIVTGGSTYGAYEHFAMALPLAGGAWQPLGTHSAVRPAPGVESGAAIDEARQDLWVFGAPAEGAPSTLTNALWRTSLAPGGGWEPVVPLGEAPAPRRFAVFFADPARDRLILMGGDDTHTYLRDVWELRLGAAPQWRRLAAADGAFLPYAAVQYDALRGEFWAFANGNALRLAVGADTLRTVEQFEVVPPPTDSWSPTYDFVGFDFLGRRALLVDAIAWENISTFRQAWGVSLAAGHAWTEVPIAGAGPHRRAFFAASWDASRGQLLVTGGYDDDVTYYADAWALRSPEALPTPVAAAVLSAESDAAGVRLAWSVSGAPGAHARVQRSSDGVAWTEAGEASALADGGFVWAGAPLAAESRAAFRLVVLTAGAETVTPALWIEGPAVRVLALAPAPGPPRGEFVLTFALASASPARLRVYDAAGRVVAEARPTAGASAWSLGRAPAPGLYFAELVQDGARRTTKLVAIR